MTAVAEYDRKTDKKGRITLPDTGYEHYHVVQYEDGTITLEPRELVPARVLSARTLQMMDRAIEHMDAGEVSEVVDPEDIAAPVRRR